MKIIGILLILIGIVMMVFTQVDFTTTKKLVDAGPIQINKKEDHTVSWPLYTGGIAIIGGICVLIVGRKK